jgi:hypothetical protein
MNAQARGEPAGVMLADALVLVAGVAIGLDVEPVRLETSRVVQVCAFTLPVWTYTSAYWTLARFALPAALGLAAVVVLRRVRYGGLPTAGEWLALVTTLLLLDAAVPGTMHVHGPVNTRPMTYHVLPSGARVATRHVRPAVLCDFDPNVPVAPALVGIAGLGLAALAAGWVVLRRTRAGLPSWAALLVLMALGWVWLRVPVRLNATEVVRFRYSWVDFTPTGTLDGLSGPALDWWLEGRNALGRWPVGLFAAVPAVAAASDLAREWRRARARKTEWAGAALALVLGGAWACDELMLRPSPSFAIRGVVFVVWLATLGLAARLVAGRPGRGAWGSDRS